MSVVDPSKNLIKLRAGIPIAAISPLMPTAQTFPVSVTSIQQLPRDQKLKKVLSDLKLNAIKLDVPSGLNFALSSKNSSTSLLNVIPSFRRRQY